MTSMSKSGFEHDEDGSVLTPANDTQPFEQQPLRPLSPESERAQNDHSPSQEQTSEVQTFTSRNGLSHRQDVFLKAASLIQHGGSNAIGETARALTPHEVSALTDETTHKWRQPFRLYFTIATCSLAAVEQGWAQTAMNGANLYFPAAMGLDAASSAHDAFVVGLINAGIYLSVGLWGAWLSEPINNALGRRGAVFVGSCLCLLGNLGSAISRSWVVLLLFRLVLGTGLGVAASTVSVFAAECAPAAIRGGLAVSWQMWVAFGIFLGFVANVAVYNYGENTWRLQLAMPFLPTVPLLAMVYMCPESPAWYVKRGRFDRAFQALVKLRNTDLQAAREVYSTYLLQRRSKNNDEIMDLMGAGDGESSYAQRILDLFRIPRIRRATQAAYTVMLAQQLCGINIIAFYSSTIFSDAGFSTLGALLASCVFGFVNFLGAFPAIWTMDTLGRRALLLLTLPFMAITMFAAGLSFAIPQTSSAHFVLLAALIYLFCALYSPGMGPVPCSYSAEVFPLSHREVGMGFAVASANFWAAVLSVTFPRILAGLGSAGAFELYAALNVVALVLVFLFVRETRLKSLDELDEVFAVSTRRFIRFQLCEWLPRFWKRYVLRRKGVQGGDGDTDVLGPGYRRIEQDDDDDDEEEDHNVQG